MAEEAVACEGGQGTWTQADRVVQLCQRLYA